MITELILSGGSQKGLAYLGAFKKLEELGLLDPKSLKKVVGVSIGSFVLACYIVGFTIPEFLNHVLDSDLIGLKDLSLRDESILEGLAFRSWIFDTIKIHEDPMITLKDLHAKTKIHFIIGTTCIEDGYVILDHKTQPDMPLWTALIASMNIPIVFPSLVIDSKTYIDGGVLDNFPIYLVSRKALGLHVKGSPRINGTIIDKMVHVIGLHASNLKKEIYKEEHEFVIDIMIPDKSYVNFDMSIDDKINLYMAGYDTINNSLITYKLKHSFLYSNVLEFIGNMGKKDCKEL